jgi:cytoskeleton protein RodZ
MTLDDDQNQAGEQLEFNPGIGADLRYLRERAGLSLDEVSVALRIQVDHLSALEDGLHAQLPGAAYAIGFLRTYADFLGLDADEAVERFKEEEAVRTNPTPLVFPAPIGETRRPGWRLAILSLVLAGAAYGVWAYMQNVGNVDFDRILPPPERLTDILKDKETEVAASDAAESVDTAAVPEKEDSAEVKPARSQESPVAAADTGDGGTDQQAAPTKSVPALTRVETTPVEVPPTSVAERTTTEVAARRDNVDAVTDAEKIAAADATSLLPRDETPLDVSPRQAPSRDTTTQVPGSAALSRPREMTEEAPETQEPSVAIAAPPVMPAPPPAPALAKPQPRVFGASNVDARVIVKAHSDSWVQVQGPNKETLLTRILHAGDTYRAPGRSDLVLVTGNAGAVEIIVDGESLGLIGKFGEVRRGLPLDPDRVRSALAQR